MRWLLVVGLVARAAPDPPWSVVPLARYVPGFDERVSLFLVHDASAYDARAFRAPLGGEDLHVLPTRCGGQARRLKKRAGGGESGGARDRGRAAAADAHASANVTNVMVLKLASSGSTWFGDLLKKTPGVSMKPELIPGSGGERMSTQRKQRLMAETLARCAASRAAAVCGFSINSKNAATVDFGAVAAAATPRARVVVWIRSNLVASALGKWRASQLKELCHTNNVKAERAQACALPNVTTFPLRSFEKSLEAVALYSAVNLGAAYRGREACGGSAPAAAPAVYEAYYEALLADRDGALAALAAWLGLPPAAAQRVGADRTVKSTPAELRTLLANFDELRAWLAARAPCLVAHLESSGREVMAPCPLHFNVTARTNGLEKVGRAQDLRRPPASHGGGGGGTPAGTDDDEDAPAKSRKKQRKPPPSKHAYVVR